MDIGIEEQTRNTQSHAIGDNVEARRVENNPIDLVFVLVLFLYVFGIAILYIHIFVNMYNVLTCGDGIDHVGVYYTVNLLLVFVCVTLTSVITLIETHRITSASISEFPTLIQLGAIHLVCAPLSLLLIPLIYNGFYLVPGKCASFWVITSRLFLLITGSVALIVEIILSIYVSKYIYDKYRNTTRQDYVQTDNTPSTPL
jgi:hypothetical protein